MFCVNRPSQKTQPFGGTLPAHCTTVPRGSSKSPKGDVLIFSVIGCSLGLNKKPSNARTLPLKNIRRFMGAQPTVFGSKSKREQVNEADAAPALAGASQPLVY